MKRLTLLGDRKKIRELSKKQAGVFDQMVKLVNQIERTEDMERKRALYEKLTLKIEQFNALADQIAKQPGPKIVLRFNYSV
jgi:hypothetical protein